MSFVFLSYSRRDVDFARYLRGLLENENINVWMDEKRLVSGDNWWKSIERNIDECSAFVVVMSSSSDSSVYVHNEILVSLFVENLGWNYVVEPNSHLLINQPLLESVEFSETNLSYTFGRPGFLHIGQYPV